MPYVTHPNGQKSYYEIDDYTDPWKPSETILIQHGFARHLKFWYHWIPPLARHYRVVRRDARGHGNSSAPGKDYAYTADTILDEIADTLDQLGIQKVHYLGESTGGIFGEAFAAKYPDRVLSLTTISSPLSLPPDRQQSLAFGYESWPDACRKLGSRGWAEQLAKLLKTDEIEDLAFMKWWIDEVAVPSGDALGDHAELLAKIDAREFVGKVKCSMLILAPTNSSLATKEGQKELQGLVKGSKLVYVDGKGHEIYVDKGEECQKHYLEFLNGLK